MGYQAWGYGTLFTMSFGSIPDRPTMNQVELKFERISGPTFPGEGTDQDLILQALLEAKRKGYQPHDDAPVGSVLGFDLVDICIDYRRRISDLRQRGWHIPFAVSCGYTGKNKKPKRIGAYWLEEVPDV